MILLGLLAGYFTLFMSGFGVAILIMSRSTRINIIECACLAWLFGVGIVSISLWLGGTLIPGAALQLVVSLVCLALALTGWRVKKNKGVRFALPLPSSPVEWLLTALLLLELLALFIVSLKHTLGWDGLFNWEIKARYAFLNNGVLPGSYYSSPGRAYSHPEYPLAIPFTELWLYLWMGVPHQFWIKTIFPIFHITGALLTCLFVTRLTGKRWLGLLIALLLPFVPFVTASPGGVIVGYADIPLSIFYVAALGYFLCSMECELPHSFTVYAVVLALVPWIKSEGLILSSLLAMIGLFVGFCRHRVWAAILSTLPWLCLIIGWRLYLAAMHVIMPSDFARPTLHLLSANLQRLTTIGRIAFVEITDTGLWSVFWLLALFAIIYLLVARRLSRLLLAVAVVGPIFLYLLTYIFSAWPSYTAHITSSLPRLLLHVVPAAWLAIGLALSNREEKTLRS